MRGKKLFVCLLLVLSIALPALAEGFDVSPYSYEELLEIRDTVNEAIREMERQYAIEHGNRKITFEESEATVFKGATLKLEPSVRRVTEEAPEETSFVYTSSDPEIAKVSSAGTITGVGYGDCVITCTAKDDENIFCVLPVHVVLKVSGISLNEETAELLLGTQKESDTSIQLAVSIEPENAFVRTVTWKSSDETVATVDANGNVRAVAPGKATITATSDDEPAKDKKAAAASCKVSVLRAVEQIELDSLSCQVYKGSTRSVKVTVLPEDASVKDVEWTSSDPEIVSVSSKGVLTGESCGTAVVTCAATDGSEIIAQCNVRVIQRVTGMSLSAEEASLLLTSKDENAAKTRLIPSIEPDNAYVRTVTWTSSDETVATVDANGNVQAIAPGKATITATSDDEPAKDQKAVAASCKVSVLQSTEKIELNESNCQVYKGSTRSLSASILPEEASVKDVEWMSSNPEIVSVSAKGVLTGETCGTAVVTCAATDGSGVIAQCNVQVIQRVTGMSLNAEEATLLLIPEDENAAKTQLTPSIEPDNAHVRTVTWTSSDETVAAVDANGNVRAIAPGKATITATSDDEPAKDQKAVAASCKVTVHKAVTEIQLDKNELVMDKGKKATLSAKVFPEDATEKNVSWVSSNPDVVSINSKGEMTAKACGSVVISCTATDGSTVYDTCRITVIQMVTKLSVKAKKVGVTKDYTYQIPVTLTPADATNRRLKWASSNERVATVSGNGVVTAASVGLATITAQTTDGSNLSIEIQVAVEPVNGVYIDYINYKSTWGIVKNSLSVQAKNLNQFRTVKGFDFIVKCEDSSGYTSTNYLSWKGQQIKPGSTMNDKYQSGLSGYSYARQLDITVTTIYYTDGTVVNIPVSEQQTSSFRF